MITYKVVPIRYRYAIDLVAAWLDVDSRKSVLASKKHMTFTVGDKQYPCKTGPDHLKFIRKQRLWGFCKQIHKNSWEIHFWVRRDVSTVNIMEIIVHELAHVFGYGEDMAAKFGGLASFGCYLWKQEQRCSKLKKVSKRRQLRLSS